MEDIAQDTIPALGFLKKTTFSILSQCMRLTYFAGMERQLRRFPGALPFVRFAYRHTRPDNTVVATIEGHDMYIDPQDTGVGFRLLTLGVIEPEQTSLFKWIVQPGHVVVDVGANIGYYTFLAADLVGKSGRVFGFEPAERNFALLSKSVKSNDYRHVTVTRKAVSDCCGVAKLLLGEQNWGVNRISRVDEPRSVAVETISLDQFFQDRDVLIDSLKVDAEGAEAAILRGAHRVLRANPELVLFTEFNPKLIQEYGDSPYSYLSQLDALGFNLVSVDGQLTPLRPDQFHAFTNDLCSRPLGEDYANLVGVRGEASRKRLESFTTSGHCSSPR